jgi:hypothetical protein
MKHALRFLFAAALVLLCGLSQKGIAQQYDYLDVQAGYETLNCYVSEPTGQIGVKS